MKEKTQQVTREGLVEKAREAERREADLIARLNALPGRVAEAKREAESRFNVATHELRAGRTNIVPTLDYSEAQAIAGNEEEIAREAKEAGLLKLRLFAALHRHDEAAHADTFEKLGPVQEDLEAQYAKITTDLRATRDARATSAKKRDDAMGLAMQYERAAALHEQADNPIRRMV